MKHSEMGSKIATKTLILTYYCNFFLFFLQLKKYSYYCHLK